MLGLLTSHGVPPGRGPVVSAHAEATSANDTTSKATRVRIGRSIEPPRVELRCVLRATTLNSAFEPMFFRVFSRHRGVVLRHLCWFWRRSPGFSFTSCAA